MGKLLNFDLDTERFYAYVAFISVSYSVPFMFQNLM